MPLAAEEVQAGLVMAEVAVLLLQAQELAPMKGERTAPLRQLLQQFLPEAFALQLALRVAAH